MAKIELDKYYTPKKIAEHCYNKTIKIYGKKVASVENFSLLVLTK